jgi:hypothetical protein
MKYEYGYRESEKTPEVKEFKLRGTMGIVPQH